MNAIDNNSPLSDTSSQMNASNNNALFAAPTAAELFYKWVNRLEERQLVSSPESKKEYFLTARDLSYLVYEPRGGEEFATGAHSKWYCHIDLLRESLRKHGEAGVKRKLVARYKREEKQRMKEERAAQAFRRLRAEAVSGAAAAALTSHKIKKLRRDFLERAKMNMDYKYGSDAPKKWKFEVPSTTKAAFAAIMGRPNDVELESFVQNGAYYTVTVDAWDFFDIKDEHELIRWFDCCSQKIAPDVTVSYKPTTMELSVSGIGEMHQVPWKKNAYGPNAPSTTWRHLQTSPRY